MPYVVTLQGYRPPPRYDSQPYTQAVIEEAPASAGPWTQIELVNLVPDADPSRPAERDFTTEDAALAVGWYRVTFRDAQGDAAAPSDPVYSGSIVAYRPTLEEVAAHIRSRTRNTTGQELGTFTQDTRPTDNEAESLIDRAVRDVQVRAGTVPDSLAGQAGDLASLRTAMLIELTYFPEQVTTGRSPYTQLKELYDESMASFLSAVDLVNAGEEPGGGADLDNPGPYYYYGDDQIIGTRTPL